MALRIAGLATLLRSLRKFIRIYLRYKPKVLDRLNPRERELLTGIADLIDELFKEVPIPD